jgi:hypothetical protein
MSVSSPKAHLGYHLLHKLNVNLKKKKRKEREKKVRFFLYGFSAMESPGSDNELASSLP